MNADDLIERARRLDRYALGEIHDSYYPQVYGYLCFRLGDENACEAITRDVFVQFLEAIQTGRGPKHDLYAWLAGTASRLADDHLRKESEQRLERGLMDVIQRNTGTGVENVARPQWVDIQAAIQNLPSEQGHILALRFANKLTSDEISGLIGKRIQSVKDLQFRALVSLVRALNRN